MEGLSRTGFFKDVSFSVRKGEILAITGLDRSGRTEVCEAIYGITQADSGRVLLAGEELRAAHPPRRWRGESATFPRIGSGRDSSSSGTSPRTSPCPPREVLEPRLDEPAREEIKAKELAERLEVKANSVYDLVATLSGGNQQKVSSPSSSPGT